MAKIEKIGNGFISVNGALINLKAFKEIKKEELGLFEADDGEVFSIAFTPLYAKPGDLRNGVEGTWHATYQDEKLRDSDFEEIKDCLSLSD